MAGIYIETFGCQMNEADSRYIADRATSSGYEIVSDPKAANVVVLNTCTVRDNAERRAYGRMTQFKALKHADPSVKLVVCGCLAEQDRDRMQTIVPYVDAVFGTSELARMGDAIAGWRDGFGDDDLTDERYLAKPLGGEADCVANAYSHLRAFVNVQRGCSYYCTYCIVPYVRGRFDNRPVGEILREVEAAIAAGAREITLVGQTVNAYREPALGTDFAALLHAVAALPGLDRLTFLTSHPKDFTPALARALAEIPQLSPRFHLPVQSGSDPVLRRMNRKYTLAQYEAKIALFRAQCPAWSLTTDLIVAFPGETADDFAATLALCERMQFAQAFMFVYSPRRGTPAARWEPVPSATGGDRLRALAAVVDRGVRAYHDRKVGSVVRALVQGPSRKDPARLSAKTTDNVTVVAHARGLAEADLRRRPWLDVRLDAAHVWGCDGTIVASAERFEDPSPEAVREPAVLSLIS